MVSGTNPIQKSGFTFIELLIVLTLVGFLTAIVLPNLNRFRPGYERKAFITGLTALTQRAWQGALSTHQTHRLFFDIVQRTVLLQREATQKDEKGELVYATVGDEYIPASIMWPHSVEIKDFFINSVDEMHRPGAIGYQTTQAWFYVYPDGTTQEVIINLFDTGDATQSEAGTAISLVLSPFTAKFIRYDTFQRP